MLKGIRVPNRWVATHLQFDYSQGFFKRSLAGAALKALGVSVAEYATVMTLSSAVTLACVGAGAWLIWRAGLLRSARGAALTLVFTSSYAIALLAHFNGYFDVWLLALLAPTLGAVLRAGPGVARWASLGASAIAVGVGLFVHENALVLVAPPLCLALWLKERRLEATLLGAAALGTTLWLMEHGVGDEQTVRQLIGHHRRQVDFPLRHDAFKVFARSTDSNIEVTLRRFERPRRLGRLLGSLVTMLPAASLFIYMATRRMLHAWRARHVALRASSAAILVAASLAPLGLHLFGWDMHRWNALAVISSFLCLLVCVHLFEARPLSPRERYLAPRLAALIIAFNLAAGFGFFDGYQPTNAPFFKHWDTYEALQEGKDSLEKPPRW